MTRNEAIRTITQFAGPLGPFVDPEEQDRREEAWTHEADALERVLDLAACAPSASELKGIAPQEFEYELSRILTMIGNRIPVEFLSRVGPLLDDSTVRRTIIEVIGAMGLEEGLRWLVPMIGKSDLSEEDAVRLACAIGEIDGTSAPALLDKLEQVTPPDRIRVLDEIAIARKAL